MEYIPFRIKNHERIEFESAFRYICTEENIDCTPLEFEYQADCTIAFIPDYAIRKMTSEEIKMLEGFKIKIRL